MAIQIQPEDQGSILHLQLSGKLTKQDYEQFVPQIDAVIAKVKTVRLLVELHDFHGWTAGALWSDLSFGITHFRSIDSLAFVGEKPWQKGMALFCRPFTMARIRFFEADKMAAARDWLRQRSNTSEKPAAHAKDAPEQVRALINAMSGDDGVTRQNARKQLVGMGSAASNYLIDAAHHGSWRLRLEATQALAEIADPQTATQLAAQFEDTAEIGWAAAEGIKHLGIQGARAALQEIVQHPNSHGVRVSAHHALRECTNLQVRETVQPVVEALAESVPAAVAPVAAHAALKTLG